VTRSIEGYLFESLLVLLVVVLLAVALLYAARRAGVGQAVGPVELLARLPLEARRSVYVVRIVDQVLILGASEAGLEKLGELSRDALAQLPPGVGAGGFSSVLRAALNHKHRAGAASGSSAEPPVAATTAERSPP
jgi:flagellar biogenesis protein FliO